MDDMSKKSTKGMQMDHSKDGRMKMDGMQKEVVTADSAKKG
jgi:hypothetical protein